MLIFNGYGYVENRQSSKSIFWRCSQYMKHQCRARVVTSKDPKSNEIRVLDHEHTHQSTKWRDKYENDYLEVM